MDQVSPDRSALAHFKVRPSYATDAATATALVAEIIADAGEGLIAVDLETTPLPSERARLADLTRRVAEAKGKVQACDRSAAPRRGGGQTTPPRGAAALAIAKAELAALLSADDHAERAGLDPHRSTARLCSLYGGGARVAVIDLHKVDWAVLAPVWERPIVMHNAAFDLGYLAQRGIEPVGVDCTLQAVRLLNGPNATSLETAAASYFGLALDKALQTSDWGAKHLSLAQVAYAAGDAVVTWWLAETVLPLLGERRTAYDIQVGAIPAVVRMQLRGILLDATAHAALIAALKAERARLADVYAAACEEAGRPDLRRAGVPDNAPAIEALLAGLLDGAGAAGLAADAEEREAQHQAGRPRRGRGRLSAAQGARRHRPDREAAQHLWRAPGGADLAGDRPHPRLLQGRRRDLRPQHLQQAEHAEHPRRPAGRGVAELSDAVRGADGLRLRCGRLVLDGDAGGRLRRGGRDHDAGLRARRGPARAHREDHARARRGRLAGPARGRAQAASQARQAGEFRPALRAGGQRSRRLGAGAVRPDPRPGHSEGVDQGLRGDLSRLHALVPGLSRAPASAAAASRSGARAGASTRSTGMRTVTATPSASICRSRVPAPTPSCWRWRRSTRPCSRRGSRAARSRRRTTRSCWKCREADAARAAVLLKEAMTAAFAATFPGAPLRDLVAVKIGRSWAETK